MIGFVFWKANSLEVRRMNWEAGKEIGQRESSEKVIITPPEGGSDSLKRGSDSRTRGGSPWHLSPSMSKWPEWLKPLYMGHTPQPHQIICCPRLCKCLWENAAFLSRQLTSVLLQASPLAETPPAALLPLGQARCPSFGLPQNLELSLRELFLQDLVLAYDFLEGGGRRLATYAIKAAAVWQALVNKYPLNGQM